MKTISKGSIIQIIYNGVSIESNTLDCYSVIIEKLIRDKYSVSQVEAIVNNYLSDMFNEHYKIEFNKLQKYRREVKDIAKKIITFIKDNDLANKPDGIYEIK